MLSDSSTPANADRAIATGKGDDGHGNSADRREPWLQFAAATPWLLLLIAGLLWALTSPRAVKYAGSFLIAQPVMVAVILVLAAVSVAAIDVVAGVLALLWQPSSGGVLAVASDVTVCGGAAVLWH